jgi:hypothetical protein
MSRPPVRARTTIGTDPFAAVIPTDGPETEPEPDTPPASRATARSKPSPAEPARSLPSRGEAAAESPDQSRQKLTVHLDGAVVNRVKNAAYWNPRLTIASIAERGIRLALKEVEKENGGPYPQRDGALVGGRPIK